MYRIEVSYSCNEMLGCRLDLVDTVYMSYIWITYQIKYGLVGWNASSGFDGYVYGNIMNIKVCKFENQIDFCDDVGFINCFMQDVIDGRTVDMMSVNISGGQSLFWRTQNNYFKGKSLV